MVPGFCVMGSRFEPDVENICTWFVENIVDWKEVDLEGVRLEGDFSLL